MAFVGSGERHSLRTSESRQPDWAEPLERPGGRLASSYARPSRMPERRNSFEPGMR